MVNPSRLFILRPVATTLLMTALLLAGLLAYKKLPISALPEIDYPTIQVVTLYPGAGPEVVASTITAPLERQFGQMPGLNQMNSQSSAGASVITLQFTLELNLEVAEQQVQAAINAANTFLPADLPNPPIYNKINPADPPIMILAVTSDSLPLPSLEDLVDTRFAQKISQISGVGLVTLSGGQRPAVRIQVNPRQLASYNLTLENIRIAVSNANVNIAKGSFDGPLRSSTIDANDQLQSAAEYRNLIIGYINDSPITLEQVAHVVDDAENIRLAAWYNTKPAIIVNVQRQPGANIINVADAIKERLPILQNSLPSSVDVQILTDRTITTRATVADVQIEMCIAIVLVIAIMFVFLRNVSTTMIPGVAVPLSLVGSFAVMYFLGYSINNLTLMALTIATGFVVDDAIVVTENINRYLEQGLPPLEAALKGAGQIYFTIVSLTISLVAVLIPLLFMGDVVGRLFREFAVTLTIAILLSAIISLSLTPMMCAYLLKPISKQTLEKIQHGTWGKIIEFYDRTLTIVLNHEKTTLLIAVGTLILTVVLYLFIPKGFFPVQDTGMIMGITEARQDIAFQAMADEQLQLIRILLEDKDIESISSFIGVDGTNPTLNNGRLSINLKPLRQRSAKAPEIIRRLNKATSRLSGIRLYMQSAQDLTIEDKISRTQYQFVLEALDKKDLEIWIPKLLERLATKSALQDVATDLQNKGKQAYININRDAASRLGVSAAAIDNALYNTFGQRIISTIFTQTNQYRVILEASPEFRNSFASIEHLYVAGTGGTLVPLNAIATIEEHDADLVVNRQGQFPATTISFNLTEGASLGQAVKEIKQAAEEIKLPITVPLTFQGAAKAFQASLSGTLWLIIAAIITMYIVLGILYEHFIHPVTILSTLPSAGVGALLALLLAGMDLGIIGIIGIILLIGIVKKNAIMMIDFALEGERHEGKSPREAIHQACLLRLRPILMTTFAAFFGALPLMLGSGVGSELRRPLGVSIIGGLLVSQVLTLYTTPVIYLAFAKIAHLRDKKRQQCNVSNSLSEISMGQ